MLASDFWQDKTSSKKILKEKKLFENLVNSYESSLNKLNDLDDLNQLAIDDNNLSIQNEIFENIKELRHQVKKNEINCFLSNESDTFDCYIEIHAGAGGTESQDWADMLRRMYLKWSDTKKFKYEKIIDDNETKFQLQFVTTSIF